MEIIPNYTAYDDDINLSDTDKYACAIVIQVAENEEILVKEKSISTVFLYKMVIHISRLFTNWSYNATFS